MSLNVLLISPAYPAEMPLFCRGLVAAGAKVIGLGDQPRADLPKDVRDSLSGYISVPKLWDESVAVAQARRALRGKRIDRVECLWEPGMLLAARLREALGVAGLTVEQTIPFRDKEKMKQLLDAAGIRTPRHGAARTAAGATEIAESIGFPVVIKPVDGGGAADTHAVGNHKELEAVLPRLRHVHEVSVEEYIDGEELTYDTICADGEILYENVCWYRPRPIVEKTVERLSPQTIALRKLEVGELSAGKHMGRDVLRALGFQTGFSHMEWFRKEDGEVVFGEIAARPPGARMVHLMNYASDTDLFAGWAEAICHGRFPQPVDRLYNVAMISKRAEGQGTIRKIEGLAELAASLGDALVCIELLPPGSRRRDWRMTSIGDGYLIIRHTELPTTLQLADRIGHELRIIAS